MKRTAEWGANKERTAILARVRKMKSFPLGITAGQLRTLNELETWLLLRNDRYQKRKGGLGK